MSDIPRRVTRSATKKMEEDDDNEEYFDEEEDEDEEYEPKEEEMSEEEASEVTSVEEDVTEEEESSTKKKSKSKSSSSKRPKVKSKKTNSNHLTNEQMKQLYITREEAISNADKAIFKRLIVNKFVKIINGRDEYIAVVKSADISQNIKAVDKRNVAWDLSIETTAFQGVRVVSIGDLSNSSLGVENYKNYIEDGNEKGLELMSSKQARNEIRIFQSISKAEPTEKELEDHRKYMEKVFGVKDDDEAIVFGKENKKNNVMEEESVKEKQMEEEIPTDFVINTNIIKNLEECEKRCDEMDNYLLFKKDEQSEVKEICKNFFKDYHLSKREPIYKQSVVIPKESSEKEKLSEEPLSKYL